MKKRTYSLILGLLVLSIIIVIHELGHFLWCKIFGIPTLVFSIGFGPALIQMQLWNTTFQLAALPFGGYVSMDVAALMAAPYWQKMIIVLGGIANNVLLAFVILWYLSPTFGKAVQALKAIAKQAVGFLIGLKPVGKAEVLSFMQSELNLHLQKFLSFLAHINIELAAFNLLPIPMLDGGQALRYTIQAIAHFFNFSENPYLHLVYLLVIVAMFLTAHHIRQRLAKE